MPNSGAKRLRQHYSVAERTYGERMSYAFLQGVPFILSPRACQIYDMGSLHQPGNPLTAAGFGCTIKGTLQMGTSVQKLAVLPEVSGYLTLQASLKVTGCSGAVQRYVGLVSGRMWVRYGSLGGQPCVAVTVLERE
jgi:hypothetical protein